jgi:hypothetical protein
MCAECSRMELEIERLCRVKQRARTLDVGLCMENSFQ